MTPTSVSTAPPVVSTGTSPPPQTRRLRGLSYLRSLQHHSSSSSNNNNSASSNNNNNHHSSPAFAAPTTASTPASPSPTANPPNTPASPTSPRRPTSPLTTAANAWIPTVNGANGLSRVASQPSAELSTPSVLGTNGSANPPVRSIDETISGPSGAQVRSPDTVARPPAEPAASIRFIPHLDTRSARESLIFPPVERVLRFKDERIKVGRYSDRDATNPIAPVGFKSKVVSRRHCEFWCENGQWYVKDVKSSSGTFLNHIRLSSPGLESKPFPLYDGDILQLGIDFKGGEEQIFRCVKIRVELNRAWQKALNNFNMSAHKRIRNLAKGNHGKAKESDSCSTHSSECSICLMSVAPCQSLFVAPCSHVWHYKCIRPLVMKEYPTFLCPNCRAIADLEKDIDEDAYDPWDLSDDAGPADGHVEAAENDQETTLFPSGEPSSDPSSARAAVDSSSSGIQPNISSSHPVSSASSSISPSAAIEIPGNHTPSRRRRDTASPDFDTAAETRSLTEDGDHGDNRSSTGSSNSGDGGHEGPMTPMNDAGPFVFDGGSGNVAGSPTRGFVNMEMRGGAGGRLL
ncbi:hypothetical protein RUND412_010863 [Rhizina undulata]